MTKKALFVLLSITLFSFLTSISTYFSQMPWAFVFLKSGYSFGLIPLRVFKQCINVIFLATFGISGILFIIGFFQFFKNKKTDRKYWLDGRKKISKTLFSALMISILGFLMLNSVILIMFIPQINQVGANIDQFVNKNKNNSLPILANEIRQFFADNNYNHSYGRNECVFEIDETIFTNQIDKPLIEAFGVSRGELILYQHWGGCGQSALLTEEILLKCGYDTRHAKFIDVDHEWAEAKYNGNWTIVDPWNTNSLFDIHNLVGYYPDYKNAKGVEVTFSNGTVIEEYEEYGY